MGNKEIKNPILAELDDDILDNVSGGTGDTTLVLCDRCKIFEVVVNPKVMDPPYVCALCSGQIQTFDDPT